MWNGATVVVRVDESSVGDEATTLYADLGLFLERGVRPIVVAPTDAAARAVVRTMNRTADAAVGISGADAGTVPAASADGIGAIQTRLLRTLLAAGYVPVMEPKAMGLAGRDVAVDAYDLAAAVAIALDAQRAIFFHAAGGVVDPATDATIADLTPAEALAIADETDCPSTLRTALRAAALGVRGGVGAAQIMDGRTKHAAVIEMLTARRLGTHVAGTVYLGRTR
jgi:acetylglutamate kinase